MSEDNPRLVIDGHSDAQNIAPSLGRFGFAFHQATDSDPIVRFQCPCPLNQTHTRHLQFGH